MVDAFVLERLASTGKTFSPDADKRTLIRRATFDLVGLPPTPSEVNDFLADTSDDAYEKLIDRLLDSPEYGRRWARHWLDVVGYADSEGYNESDDERPFAYKYRDYVIDAFNANLPFDDFITEQLAGDELVTSPANALTPEDQRRLIATGYLRMAPDGTGSDPDQPDVAANEMIAETIKIISTSLMGLSVGCAQCHDHRYDPILHDDYYRLRAVLEPALNWKSWKKPDERLVSLVTPQQEKLTQEVDTKAAVVQAEHDQLEESAIQSVFRREWLMLPEELRDLARVAFDTPAEDRNETQKQLFVDYPRLNVREGELGLFLELFAEGKELKKKLESLRDKIAEIREEAPRPDAIRALTESEDTPPPTFVFHRGDPSQPTHEVTPGGLSVLDKCLDVDIVADDPALPSTGRRLALARMLTDPRNPLTARVLVNRFWMHHLGRGLVATPGDFGIQGQRPTHPELLDALAAEFIASGWDLKQLHRLIMTSTVYRQSSRRGESGFDPENELYARQSVRRLEAETIRDAMLAVCNQLDSAAQGPPDSVRETEEGETIVSADMDPDLPSRRSIYVQAKRSTPLGMLDVFDSPQLEPNCTQRNCSTVTTQSLLMMNSLVLIRQSQSFAERLVSEVPANLPDREGQWINRAWQIAYADVPTDEELGQSLKFFAATDEAFRFAERRCNERFRRFGQQRNIAFARSSSVGEFVSGAVGQQPISLRRLINHGIFAKAFLKSKRVWFVRRGAQLVGAAKPRRRCRQGPQQTAIDRANVRSVAQATARPGPRRRHDLDLHGGRSQPD